MKIETSDFNLYYTLESGQVFRWDYRDGWWTGVVGGHVIRARQNVDVLTVDAYPEVDEEFVRHYFGLNDEVDEIYDEITVDEHIRLAIEAYRGLRIIRQDPWECLISYIVSSITPIPTIKARVKGLSQGWGTPIEGGYHAFPTPQQLAKARVDKLLGLGLAFRAPYIHDTTKLIASGGFNLEPLRDISYKEARRELMRLRGVGGKVADAVCLFSLDKMEAFPVDTHIDRILRRFYGLELTRERMGDWARTYYGRYAGYAQEYLYYWARQHAKY